MKLFIKFFSLMLGMVCLVASSGCIDPYKPAAKPQNQVLTTANVVQPTAIPPMQFPELVAVECHTNGALQANLFGLTAYTMDASHLVLPSITPIWRRLLGAQSLAKPSRAERRQGLSAAELASNRVGLLLTEIRLC
jgi:hypothetical protein